MGIEAKMTTLCYIEKDGAYLMLHRVSKKHDVCKDKWIGVGGHFEISESPEECLLREVKEETGLTLTSWRFRGLVTFVAEGWDTEYMCLYTADSHEGQCRLPRYLTKPRQRRSEWDMAGSDGISRVSAVFRGKSLLTNKMRII